ncbi:cilia- and flagella-associated protein 54 [Pelodytes ibericus]
MEPLPATFYGDIDQKNPVIVTFEKEIKQLLGFLRKVQKESQQQDYRRGSSTLFHIWVKYKPRLPAWYYQEKLLKVGDSLVQFKEYRLALYQCYGRYLEQFCSVDIDDIKDVNQFQSTFFPNGTDDKKAGLTFHALQGRCICIYQLVKTSDPNLSNKESVKKCLNILSFLQLVMQVVLPQEHLCWLIFNGTLHIYTICRHLMVWGHSAKALEFLLWASVSMESSVPLLSVHYLTWRSTLYTAVCQCYFDCQAGVHGEVFARRALSKISELSQLENMSNASFSEETKNAFKEATSKMAVMIFKRAVFESRRKPKGILRPKQKSNLKDLEKLPWPRTNTERLLVEMFSNNAAQFLAILEALSDSNRRVLQAGPPIPDEPEIHDVIAELFFAGINILSGGGNKAERSHHHGDICKFMKPSSLLQLAIEEKDAVSIEAVVTFAKLSFSYEHWDVFDTVITPIYTFLQSQNNSRWKKEEMDLKLLITAEPLLSGKKHKHGIHIHGKELNVADIPGLLGIVGVQGDSPADKPPDDHIILAETVFTCICDCSQDVQADRDIVIDVILFLWQKCKAGVQRITATSTEGSRFIHRCEVNSKWIYILCLLNEAMQRCNMTDTDAFIIGDAALRLATVSESMADSILKFGTKSGKALHSLTISVRSFRLALLLQKDPVAQFVFAYETLEKGIRGISFARSRVILPDERSMIDHYSETMSMKRSHLKDTDDVQTSSSTSQTNNVIIMDLQLELIVTQHRVSVKLLSLLQESEIMDKIKTNKLSKAIFLMQKAVLSHSGHHSVCPNKLLEDSEKLIHKAEAEENAIYLSCIKPSEDVKKSKRMVPPPPILVCRTENLMIFRSAPFQSEIKVSWYCLYGRCVTGPNLKVRLNDHHLSGTGEEIRASSNTLFEVSGLQANEKYIFAIAAYSSDNVLIGDSIGESTKPILAFPTLSFPAVWGYLAQSAYQVGNYQVAKKACSVLWNYFVLPSQGSSNETAAVSTSNEDYVSQKRLCHDAISKSSPILLQLFLRSVFISSDINIKEGALFCDLVCDSGVLWKWQMCRIAECEKLLVALDVSSWHGDTSYALQAVVQCYGLIAPVIYHRIPSVPVVQILIKCLVVLQEIPSSTWQKKQAGVTEGVLHMIACIVYYVAKVLRSWEEYEVAIAIIEIGKKLLDVTENTTSFMHVPLINTTGSEEMENAKEATEKEKGTKKSHKKKMLIGEKVNEQLAALELNLLKLTKPSADGKELTGQEDPLLLHAVVACWPPNTAYREVMKFKKNPRFLEFFVQLLQRELYEEKFSRVLEWSMAVFDYLKRRNEQVLGKKISEDASDVTASMDSLKRYTAAVVEYHKNPESTTLDQARKPDGLSKHKDSIKVQQKKKKGQREPQRKVAAEEERVKWAFGTLVRLLTPIVSQYMKRKRLLHICTEEMPWKAQMNLLLALTHFSLFQKKLRQRNNEDGTCNPGINSYGVLDPEVFSLHHAGTVVMATENAGDEQISGPGHLHLSLKLQLPSGAKLTDSDDFSEQSTKRSEVDTPRTQMTNETETSSRSTKEQAKLNMSLFIILDHLSKTFIHLKRAVVLAHRGGHWTLLQNNCRILWNLTLELQLMIKQADAFKESLPLTRDLLHEETWKAFYFAADMLLDMIVILQDIGSVKVVDADESFSVPSCMGGIADEEGGSNLTFEYPFDDVSVVDLRCVCHVVLRALEVLYHVKRWEALVHIAIQFNLLTHERYTEQVTPLLVHAQRILATRIPDINGANDTDLANNRDIADHGEKVHGRNYIGKHSHVGKMLNKAMDPGANTDEETIVHLVKAHVCVPIDVMDTFACFRESLQKSKYPSRALRYSRKLLTLLLAHGQGLNTQEGMTNPHTPFGKVGFSKGRMVSYNPVPPDLSEEEFWDSVESRAISLSSISTVISSYDKTIEILHSEKQQGLKAQALHELGSLHLYAGNKRAAFKCWCQALDETLNMPDALNSWQELDGSPDSSSNGRSKDYSEKFLCRAGIWGCLLAAVITAKMSRYILTSNLRKRTECCLLAASLFRALFRASLPHPQENRDYASYEIGEGCEMSELIPGIDLFSDRYRADVNTVVACLSFLMSELHSAGQNLEVLPLFTLYQYFVSMICRDPVRSIEGRLLKIKVLSDLHLFAEASREISILNHGKLLPRRPLAGFRPSKKTTVISKFSSSKSVLCKENLQAIEDILNWKPCTTLISVCDQPTLNKLELAKMHFIIKCSSTINDIPEAVNRSSYEAKKEPHKQQNKDQENSSSDYTGQTRQAADVAVQLISEQQRPLPQVKDILLSVAERRVNSILLDLQMKHQGQLLQCSAGELEIATDARLHLSEVARQRHQTPLSVAMAYSAMQLLQGATIFTPKNQHKTKNILPVFKTQRIGKKSDQVPGSEFPNTPSDTEAREHLSMRVWLRCRLNLVTILVGQMNGIAIQDQDMLDGSTIITEGIVEAETLSDIETQAHLMLQAAVLDIQEGHPKIGVHLLLQNIIHLLEGKHFISPAACLILAQSFILMADLMEIEQEENPQVFWTKQLSTYALAHKLIIKQFASLGEVVEHHATNPLLTSPLQPLRNIYLPHINLLAKVKLRIGHVLSLKACSAPDFPMDPSHFLPSFNLQTTAIQLCRQSSFREYDVEAELLFQKGKIERQMFVLGDNGKSSAIITFSEAINVSCNYDQNLGLIRKSYLEIALLYLHKAAMFTKHDIGMDLPPVKSSGEAVSKGQEKDAFGKPSSPSEFYRLLTWIAIRAATQVADAILASKQLIGLNTVTVNSFNATLHEHIPSFACMDLLVAYKNYLPDDCQINMLKQDTTAEGPTEGEAVTDSLCRGKLSWVYLIRYHNHLMRLISMSNLMDGRCTSDRLYTSVFNNGITMRFAEMHMFLKKYLYAYTTCCVDEFPQDLLKGTEKTHSEFYLPFKTSSGINYSPHTSPSPVKKPSNVSADNKQEASSEQMALNSYGRELCIQWYFPILEIAEEKKSMVLLLYAYNKQNVNIRNPRMCDPSDLFCSHFWVPLSQVLSLHEKLSILKQQAELSLLPEVESHGEKQKRSAHTAKSNTDLNASEITEELQEITKQCCSDIQTLLSIHQDPQFCIQAPFDITLPSLIRLEKMFDLTHGCMLMKGSLLDWVVSLLT